MTRKQSTALTKSARSARANAAKFQSTRAAALSQVKKSAKAFDAASIKLERLLEALAEKMEPADAAIAALEEMAAEGITGSGDVLTRGVENIASAAREAIDDVFDELEALLQAIQEARRSNV